MTKVKICGITNIEDARGVVDAGADALGFVFYKKSPRYVSPLMARRIIQALSPFVAPVAVVVNETPDTVLRLARETGIRIFQLHGEESPAVCRQIMKGGLQVIKAFRVGEVFALQTLEKYSVSAFLFDTFSKEAYGGTGSVFDWKVLKTVSRQVPLILSGGLTPRNVGEAIATLRPYAVDVSSGVEKRPGQKDVRKVRVFLRAVRKADK